MVWHIYLFPLPADTSQPLPLAGSLPGIHYLVVVPADLAHATFPRTFEEAVEALSALPRMFCEMDGSFVWRGTHTAQEWQLDGVISEWGGHVNCVEIKGCCSIAAWNSLLQALGATPDDVIVQQLPDGRFMSASDFANHFIRPLDSQGA